MSETQLLRGFHSSYRHRRHAARMAATLATLHTLRARGFDCSHAERPDVVYPRCSQCAVVVVNGIATHESTCPNAMHECLGCSALIGGRQRYCADCQ